MTKKSQKQETFEKYSGDDETFILLVSTGISFLLVDLSVRLLEVSSTYNLSALGGTKVLIMFVLVFIIWTTYFNIKNGEIK
ncbi:MAG: hypothetical protein KAS66_04000 [Candidatus Omnitrophica bacterium]|nr:hypothetical protein [Candidatus Omnitrophota bacterium]